MTKQPNNFMDAEIELANMISDVSNLLRRLDNCETELKAVRDEFDRMTLAAPNGYKSLADYLNTQAGGASSDADWTNLQGRVSKAQAEMATKRQAVIDLIKAAYPVAPGGAT